ncbi:hypothetical protein CANARDRAFT_27439 [[Candida] arabinofermentans NRRL YB-2248]|uniref:Uncharacterized protein n=1 Tax=[Candida] arabinofermentans NRRL YB-2248 TaxID=983967 RepID=A0A1E4T348_9ASCO|nr:hypothetical protein CANARDRAFT_27439 [[Candida] arabinofermentans NRRL YB-2248]
MDSVLLLLKSYWKPLALVGLALGIPTLYPKYEKLIPLPLRNWLRSPSQIKSGTASGTTSNKELQPPIITPVAPDFDYKTAKPYPFRPFKSGKYKMTLATRKADPCDTIVLENTYLERTNLRAQILEEFPHKAFACHDTCIPALKECYDYVLNFLLKRYPMHFEVLENGTIFHNIIRDEKFPLDNSKLGPEEMLKILGRTIEEDLLLMLKNSGVDGEECHEYVLRAGCSCFPAGFDPSEKFNKPLTAIHKPVPHYSEKLQLSMNRFFTRLRKHEYIVRNNWSIQAHTKLFAPVGSHASPEEVAQIEAVDADTVDFNKVFLRVEKQTFTRLPESGADLMFIKTYATPLTAIREEGQAEELCGAIDGMDEELGVYKRRIYWGPAAKKYLRRETNGSTDEVKEYKFVLIRDYAK